MNDYLSEVYDWITKQDNSFSGDVNIESFQQKMQDDSYAKEMYNWMASIDKTLPNDLSESDFLVKVKKKDSSALQSAVSPEDTGVTPSLSEDGQPSLVQLSQDSLDERFSGYKDLPVDEQISLIKQEEKRPFFEAQGIDYDKFLSSQKEKEQFDLDTSKESRGRSRDEFEVGKYLAQTEDDAFEAEGKYNKAKYEQALANYPSDQLEEHLEKENVDLGYIPTEFIKVNGESTSIKGLERKLYDQDFIDDLQAGKASIDIDNPHNTESLEYLSDLATRQAESGGQWGDLAESFYAGALDLLVAGPLEFLEGMGASTNPYQQAMYMTHGGEFSNKIHKYANKVREKTRVYSEDAITKSLLKGNFSNAMFQTGNALAESAPLILSMYAAAPLKLGQFATLGFAGASAGGIQSLELKEQRLKGEIDISDGMLLLNATLTGAAEAVFERYTLDAVNAGRKLLKMGKMDAPEIAKKFVEGFGKSLFIEGGSEAGTELSNTFTNILTGAEEYTGIEDIAVRLSDAALIGAIMGGGMHTTSHLAKSMTEARHKMLNENISVLFTLADGSTKEMSRAEALKFVKDPEVASQVRDNTISMDASINDVAKKELEEIVYGFYAPDAIAAREVMFDKEKVVQDLADKLETSKEVTPEDVNALADAMAEMEAEGKVNEYNVTDRTVATRKRVAGLLKDKGVEIVDAVQQQDTSMSEVTETADADKIDSKEQYRSIKKQIKDGKRKPTFVKSQNQPGVKIEGESVQTSEVTQGRFKSVSAARNAMKEFELKQKAAKDGKVVSDEAFPINNKEFIDTKKETLDEIPKEVLDKNEYHIISSSKKGLNAQEEASRMDKLKAALDDTGAKYYTVKGVYNGVAEESLVVTGINNAQALSLGRNLGQESVFSSKDGLMFGNGSVAPLTGDVVKGPEARKRDSLTIMNVGGRKVSMHTGVDTANMSYGKNFNSDNIHRLDESDPNYDSELFDGVPEDRKRALGFAFKLLSSIGGLNVNIVRNSDAMAGQMKQLGQDSDSVAKNKRASFFRAADKTIYVNLETVRGNTLFHEIIHPMVDFIKKTDPALYSKIEGEVYESNVKRRVTKDGRRLKGSYMEWVQAQPTYANLSKEAQIEEAFAEMMGDAAYGHFVNRQSTFGRLRELMKEILKKITPLKFDNPESVSLDDLSLTDIRKNLAGALVNGRSITVGGVEFEVGDIKGTAEDRFQVDAIDEKTQVQYKYDQNSEVFAQMEDEGIISSGKTMQDFKGKTMMVHSPDAMFSGSIIDRDGTILVEGKGGLLYTFKFNEDGYFWASTDNAANKMVDQLNSMLEANGGNIYMALTTAPQDKLLSNTAANRGLVNLLTSQNFISKIGLNKAGVYKALIDAANFKKEVIEENKKGEKIKKTIGLGLGLGAFRASSKFQDDVLQKVWDKLGNENSSFKDRKLFSDQLLKHIKSQKFGAFQAADSKANFVNFIKTTAGDKSMVDFNKSGTGSIQSIKKALINVLTEPSLREEDATDKVYAVLEIDGPVKAVKTDSYESYGTSIVSAEGNRAKIHRIDNRENWYDFAKDPKTGAVLGNKTIGRTKDGKPIYRRSQIMPSTAGISMQPLRFQAPAYDMEYTPNALISLSALSDNNRQPEQWVKEIGKGLKGASRDVDSMGLLDLLKEYKKGAKVKSIPKEVVESLIATNMSPIETTILREDSYDDPAVNYDDYSVTEVKRDGNFKFKTPNGKVLNGYLGDGFLGTSILEASVERINNTNLKEFFIDRGLVDNALFPEPMYGGFALPGGENYREFLIRDKSSEDIFRAPHYGNLGQNLIASVRADDRVGPNGEKVLFVQEIQSDWVQGTNKEDFRTKDDVTKLKTRLDELKNLKEIDEEKRRFNRTFYEKRNEKVDEIRKLERNQETSDEALEGRRMIRRLEEKLETVRSNAIFDDINKEIENIRKSISTNPEIQELKEDIEIIQELYDEFRLKDNVFTEEMRMEENDIESKIRKILPYLPWNQTDLWVGLTIRKLINQASKEGYDQIAFVNGEQSDIIQGHSDGRTSEFYNKIVPKNIDKELKRLVKGAHYMRTILFKEAQEDFGGFNATIYLTPELKAATDKIGPLRFQEVTEEEVISNFLSEQKYFQSTNPHAWAVDEVKEETLKISQIREFKGTFGVVAPNGDIKGVFNPGKTGERGTLKGLMPLLIKAGGSKLDNFDGALTGMYENLGFRVVARTPFNEEYAPPGWIKELHGTPDVVAMIYDPNAEVVFEEKSFPDPETGYGEMIEYRDSHVRYQTPDDEGTHNVYKSGLATIAWDISKAIIDSDYKAGRYLTKYIDKKQQYDIRLTTLLAKPFGTHSNKEVKEIMVRSKGNLNVELLRVSEASNKLKKAMKGSNLSRSEVNDLLHNLNEVKSMEASALKEALIEMRTHIDYLSKTLVSEGLVKGQTQFTIDSNLGVYVTRSYKQFDVKGWTQTDNDIIKNAKDFLYREAKKDNPEATEERLQEIVGVAYRKLTEDKEFFRSSNGATNLDGLTRVNSIFKEKKIIPEEIRDLWGEIDNPLYNYSNTISKVARTISAERMYKDLNEIGQGKFISDIQTPETYNELVGSKWGSLEGKFVDEEMFAVMNQTVKNLEGNLWYDSYMRLVLFNKKMKTVWNPGTHAKNVIGNTSFAIMNGHIGFNGGMYKDAKTAIKAVQSLKSPELKALYSKLVALGVVNSSASLQEIRGIAEDINDTKFDLSEYLDEKSGKIQKLMAKAARATGKPIKYLDKKAMQAYQAEDDVWKIFGYLSEKARYVKAGMDAKAAEELAAKNIRNLYPNYNEIPRIIRYLGRSPIVGSFVAFQAESIRNAKNTVLLGFEELGSGNPGMRKIGAQRIGGTLATMTLLEGLQLYTAQFLGEALGFGGEDDEEVEDRKMRLLLPEWDAAGNIAYMFKGKLDSKQAKDKQTEGDRYFDYINFSSISGVGYAKDIIRLSFYDLDTQIGKESAMNTLKKIYAPFLGQEMTLKVMIDALGNKGGKVYNPSENGIKQAIDIVTFIGEQVKPGAVKSGLRLKESMYDLDSELVPGYEALALFGLRISRVNVNKGLGIKSNFIYKDMINTVDKSILRDRVALLKEAEENPQFDEYLNQMADLIGATRLNSVSGEDIKAILYNSRVSKPVIEEAYLRYLDRYLEDVIRVDSK